MLIVNERKCITESNKWNVLLIIMFRCSCPLIITCTCIKCLSCHPKYKRLKLNNKPRAGATHVCPWPLRSNHYNHTLTRGKRGGWFIQGKPEYIVTSITHIHNGYLNLLSCPNDRTPQHLLSCPNDCTRIYYPQHLLSCPNDCTRIYFGRTSSPPSYHLLDITISGVSVR